MPVDDIIVFTTEELVVTTTAAEEIVARSAIETVNSITAAEKRVVARSAVNVVGTQRTGERVIAIATQKVCNRHQTVRFIHEEHIVTSLADDANERSVI